MTEKNEDLERPIEIALSDLSEDALDGIVENFILREGTDYGLREIDLETKKKQVYRQLNRGDVKIVFDQKSETVGLLAKENFLKLQKKTGL